MEILVKNEDKRFLPVLLGTDANAYGMAKSFHKAYGIKSLSLGVMNLMETANSKIVTVDAEPGFDRQENFAKKMEEVGKTYGQYYEKLLLIACGDHYTELIVNNRELLEKYFVFAYISREMKEQLENKEDFYKICEKYGLDYPKTCIITKENYSQHHDLPFGFPVAVKASDSIEYVELSFDGKKKGYKADTYEEFEKIVNMIYAAGYNGNLIVQDFIPGDDATMWVLNSYSGLDGKVRAMCLGHCVLEDYTPAGIGNYNAIIQHGDMAVYERYRDFLEEIGYVGFSNFDMKYDERDGKFKVFEINIRQGRSSYFTTASGCNIAKILAEDVIEGKPLQEIHYHDNPFLWLHVPEKLVMEYTPDEVKDEVKSLIDAGKYDFTLKYDKDGGLFRKLRVNRYYKMAFDKYSKYFNKRGLE